MFTVLSTGTLQNLSTVIAKSKESGSNGNILAATVLRAASYQALIDCYGEIPYSEALNPANLSPKYDEGKDVYAGIVKELDDALANCVGTESVCTNFLMPGARASEWVKLANALKLRILMRESLAVDVKAQLDALVAENNFPTADVQWEGCWANESGHANPYYQEEFATYFGSTQQNVVLNLALLAAMNVADDGRLTVWFNPNTDKKEYTGGISGTQVSRYSQPQGRLLVPSQYQIRHSCNPDYRCRDRVLPCRIRGALWQCRQGQGSL